MMAAIYDEYDATISVTDANGMKATTKVTIIVTGNYVEMPEMPDWDEVLDKIEQGQQPEVVPPTLPTGCPAFAYVSSFIAAAGLALLVFKKRH